MNTSKNSDSHHTTDEINSRSHHRRPPAEATPGATISVYADWGRTLNSPRWCRIEGTRSLADPLGAAAESGIPLSPSESAILKTIPAQTLGQMIFSVIRTRLAPLRDTALAAGTASAALLAATDVHGDDHPSRGIRPDIPPEPVKPTVQRRSDQVGNLAGGGRSSEPRIRQRAVMVVCPYGAKTVRRRTGPPGTLGITVEMPTSRLLHDLCHKGIHTVNGAAATAKLIAVKPFGEAAWLKENAPGRQIYVKMLEKYGVADDAPLVIFLAPDGTVLSRVQPADERKIVGAIKAVPALLAKWLATRGSLPAPTGALRSFGLTP